jgi:hypothetical protein
MVLDADYTNLDYSEITSGWWVTLGNLDLGDDPVHFEGK